MNVLTTARFNKQEIHIYGTSDRPLFLAVDVAKAINYSNGNTGQMLETVDEDEKVFLNVNDDNTTSNARGNPNKWFLTENGLYEVLFQSRKSAARKFKKLVKLLLRSVRKGETISTGRPIDITEWVSEWMNKFESVEDLDSYNVLREDFGLPAVTDIEAFGEVQERTWYEKG